jgi:protein SCO1/2
MKILLTLLLLASSLTCYAADTAVPPPAAAPSAAAFSASEQGAFSFQVKLADNGLKNGPNSFELLLRDRSGRPVEGAQLKVTPWMPTMGHGVWEKPVVKELGGGAYHVENVVIIMGGVWELRIAIKKGDLEDRGAYSTTVAEAVTSQQEPVQERTGYDRTTADYNVPNVTLINQDGQKVNLRALIDSGKPVVIDFIFTTCTTICPVLSAGFTNLRKTLGADAQKAQLISITIDPENDRPEKLKQYLKRFNGGPGWDFLTGSREDVGRVLRAFNAFVVDKMSHEPLYLLRAPNGQQWVRIKGLIKKSDLVSEYRRIENK